MALPLRCACEVFRLARGDCSLLAIADSTLLVCGTSTGEVLARPSDRRLRCGTAAFVAPGDRGDRFLSAQTLSSGPGVYGRNCRRPRADCFRGLNLLAGPSRSRNGAACGQDRTHGPGEIARRGIYARIRHPRYAGSFLAIVGACILAGTCARWFIAGVWLALTLAAISAEERELRARFGAAYEEYSRRVPRFIPSLRK
jgi:hypothetical protein